MDATQIREKDLTAKELLALTRESVKAARELEVATKDFRARVIVNDRLDVALASGADGVHLGGDSEPARDVTGWRRRGKAPAGFLIGASCHGLNELVAAEQAGVDYIYFGPVFDTPSKRAFGAPQGIARLAEICGKAKAPVIAIGGVNAENAEECIRAGAAGIAAIRMFQEATDLDALRSVVERLHQLK